MTDATQSQEQLTSTPLNQAADFRLTQMTYADPEGVDKKWISVVLEIEGAIEDFIGSTTAFKDDMLIPVAYDHHDRTRNQCRQPLSMFGRKRFLDAMNEWPAPGKVANNYGVISMELGAETPKQFLDFSAKQPDMREHPLLDDDAVVMAVIDDGIAIGNDLFRDRPDSSRVHFAAILDAEPVGKKSRTSVGRVLDKGQIDKLLDEASTDGLLDPDEFYARTGQVDYRNRTISTVALRSSHGTHVMSLAAGHCMNTRKRKPTRPIICFALPARLVADTTGVYLLPSLYLGFHMLVKQARRFRTRCGRLAPVVFNFSYGNSGGPHDGTGLFASLFEHYFNLHNQTEEEPQQIWLTLPAGNANLLRLHGAVAPGQGETAFNLSVQPDDRTISKIQIWMPYAAAEPSEVAEIIVETPFGHVGEISTRGWDRYDFLDSEQREFARLSYHFIGGRISRGLAELSISQTISQNPNKPLAPPGDWKIRIRRGAEASDHIQLWIRRDETLPGFAPGGRQTYFNNPDYQRFGDFGLPLAVDPKSSDCPVERAMTQSGFACSTSPIIVGAYTEKEAMLSLYSAAGPLNEPSALGVDRRGPDLAGKGDHSFVLPGILGAGSRSGSLVRRSGTSAAAPLAARAAADVLSRPENSCLSARDWAKSPPHYDPNTRRFAVRSGAPVERIGSGAYEFPGPADPTKPFGER